MSTVKEIAQPQRLSTVSPPGPQLPRKSGPLSVQSEAKRLTVGREISLSGEISSCDTLVVEGEIRANLKNCRTLEIARSGTFRGDAEISVADIAGNFEGALTVIDRLILRSTGRIMGTIRYREIEIERGGQIAGTVEIRNSDAETENAEPLSIA